MKHVIKAFKFSIQGLKYSYKNEIAFKQIFWSTMVLLPVAIILSNSKIEAILLITPIFITLIVEIINSAIEAVVDRISAKQHPLSGAAKDMGSAATFLAILLLVTTWIIVLVG